MNVGKLRHRITIQQRAEARSDIMGRERNGAD